MSVFEPGANVCIWRIRDIPPRCGVDLPPKPPLRAVMATDDDTDRFDALLTLLEQAIDLMVLSDRDAHRPLIATLCCEAAALSGAWAEPSR